jgi:hypothetical protein
VVNKHKEETMMSTSFFRSAFLNALKGAGFGLVSVWVIALLGVSMIATGQVRPKAGVLARVDVLSLGGVLWGALVGFCATRPVPPSRGRSLLLTIIAVLGSVLVSLMITFLIPGSYTNIGDVLAFAILGPGVVAGLICGIQHFYSPENSVS